MWLKSSSIQVRLSIVLSEPHRSPCGSIIEPTHPRQGRVAAASSAQPDELIYNQRDAWEYYQKFVKVKYSAASINW